MAQRPRAQLFQPASRGRRDRAVDVLGLPAAPVRCCHQRSCSLVGGDGTGVGADDVQAQVDSRGYAAPAYTLPGELVRERGQEGHLTTLERATQASRWGELSDDRVIR